MTKTSILNIDDASQLPSLLLPLQLCDGLDPSQEELLFQLPQADSRNIQLMFDLGRDISCTLQSL